VATPPAYSIRTPRVLLRCWNLGDAPALFATVEDNVDHLRRFMPWIAERPPDAEAQLKRLRVFRSWFDRDEQYFLGVFDAATGAVIGGTGLHKTIGPNAFEIGYWLSRRHVGKGLATETVSALLRVAFEIHEVSRVEIRCAPTNAASARIPARLGFLHEATLARRLINDGHIDDLMIWSMWSANYHASDIGALEVEACDGAGRRLL
jgi:RimJ/RimL family protein N-acetyltransferase